MEKLVIATFTVTAIYEHPQVGATQGHSGNVEMLRVETPYRSRQGVSYGPTVSSITTIGLPIPSTGTTRRTLVAYANTTAMEVDTDVLTAYTYTVTGAVGQWLFVEGEEPGDYREWPDGVATADTIGSSS